MNPIVDVVWMLLIVTFGNPDVMVNVQAHQTRRQCMQQRALVIDRLDEVVRQGRIQSYVAECLHVEKPK